MRLVSVAISLVVAFAMAEVLVRVFYPISDGRDNVGMDGKPITGWVEPGSVYRQISNEYDAHTTITDQGYRAPRAEAGPDVVFIGDSFTFGWGLRDDETFASIYCAQLRRNCANLGEPGTGTLRQVARLDRFLSTLQWQPSEVKLFFFGMSGSLSNGNDFVDNYNQDRSNQTRVPENRAEAKQGARRVAFSERLLRLQPLLLEKSNLIRIAKYYWGPMLRSMIVARPDEERMAAALRSTERGLLALDDLSRRRGFTYSVYLIVPVQDIIRRTHPDTLATLNSVSPKPAVTTADLFLESPETFYYAFDGHLNREGSRRIAEFLVSREQ